MTHELGQVRAQLEALVTLPGSGCEDPDARCRHHGAPVVRGWVYRRERRPGRRPR